MKNYYSKSRLIKAGPLLLLAIAMLVINSCRKDVAASLQQQLAGDPDLAQAKAWYDSTYPDAPAAGGTGTGNGLVQQSTASTHTDLSRFYKPGWLHTKKYNRFNKSVIEMPLDSTNKVVSGLRKTSGANTSLNKDYTKSSFLLLKDSAGYKAYIMVIIADADYIKNDPTKLSRNSYAKRDSDFSGSVLYFTPKGAYVNGYAYKNGVLVTSANQSSRGQTVQSTGAVKVNTAEICTDWFIDVYEDDVLVYTEYIGTSCYSTGGNDGGAGGGGAPPPTPCTTPPPTDPPVNAESIISGGTLKVASQEPGGGYGPPTDCDDGCSVENPDFSTSNTDIGITDGPPSPDPLVRTKIYSWTFMKSGTWSWASVEKGTHKLNGQSWEWVSLEHVSDHMIGTMDATNSTVKVITTAPTCQIVNAYINLAYQVISSTSCSNQPPKIVNSDIKIAYKSWDIGAR